MQHIETRQLRKHYAANRKRNRDRACKKFAQMRAAKMVSAAPAKHPDTEIVDWLDTQFQGGDDWCRLFPLGNTIREAYAAVRVTIAEEPL